jgi:hypothetical protein
LRSEAEVGDDGDFGVGEGADEFDARAFDFDGFGAGFLDEADGVGEAFGTCRCSCRRACRRRRGAMDGAADGAGVVEHLVHGDGEGVFVAEDDHGRASRRPG